MKANFCGGEMRMLGAVTPEPTRLTAALHCYPAWAPLPRGFGLGEWSGDKQGFPHW